MALPDNRFIASTSLEEYFVDKNTGLPLAGGKVYFYQDIARTNPKLVYKLAGDPNNVGGYSFVPLSNPLILSATGTFLDGGNEIAVYYFPYDGLPATSTNTLDLYYIVVQDSLGVDQFTRSAWPSIAEDLVDVENLNTYENQVSNSQFVDVSFGPFATAAYSYASGGNFVYRIAPDWELAVIATGPGIISVTRNPIAGGPPVLTNPPYTLTVVPGANLTTLAVRQILNNNPGIWSQTNGGGNGYISGSILLYPNSQVLMKYVPSTGPQTTILNKNNTGGSPAVYNATVQLPISTNPSAPPTGFASIYLYLPVVGAGTTFSSVQVVGLADNQASVPYVQQTANRQLDNLFHYYNPLLQFKPIKSYLTGWDFPLNPAQFGTSGNVTGSVNRSNYTWDQTIVYSSAATGVSYNVNPATNGLRITATGAATQVALIQYLDQVTARAILNNDLSVNVSMSTNNPTGLTGTVSLWYTTAASLPNASTVGINPNQSIVQTLDINGSISFFFGTGWTEVKRNLIGGIPAKFVAPTAVAGTDYFNIPLSGWGANNAGANTATYFAIVVGFASLPATRYLDFNSISLVPGRIATIPAPQTENEALIDCQRYYWDTYLGSGLSVGSATNIGARIFQGVYNYDTITNISGATSFTVDYPTSMVKAPTITFYSPFAANQINKIAVYEKQVTNGAAPTHVIDTPISGWSSSVNLGYKTKYGAFFDVVGPIAGFTFPIAVGTVNQLMMQYHVTVDARLGIV